ncbi:MAG TPA: phosphoglycerate mutase (2,3-diphosphoglycerate-independent), partial [candidate division Zixibacteria bacterium]|nr:phosphoglycerate mutase (2,3-diphosphoglycerate-independent) [candidate division Zixibacteria bacterium]
MSEAPIVLVILDGWGLSPHREANAVRLARTPYFDRLWGMYPHTQLNASGQDVGLPANIMGNSEVGHLNLGAGRVVQQEVTRINQAIDDERFFSNEVFTDLLHRLKSRDGALHLIGLMSNGLVHSAEKHYLALLDLVKRHGLPGDRVFVHPILDGRDTPPRSAPDFLRSLQQTMYDLGVGRMATVTGRYYAMDRDNRWERIQKAYDAYTRGTGEQASSAEEAIQKAYDRGETDEFVLPTVLMAQDAPVGPVKDGDGVLMFNYRADRGREMLRVFTVPDFDGTYLVRLRLSEHMQRRIFWMGYYSTDIVALLKMTLRPGMVVVDVGANIGEIAMVAARCVGRGLSMDDLIREGNL